MKHLPLYGLLAAALATASPLYAAKAQTLPMLKAQGAQIVDDVGHKVTLRGFNLGGWLVEEMWMQPFVTSPPPGSSLPKIKDHVTLWSAIETRLGPAAKRRVQTAFRNAWIDESDFDRMKAAGINCVRLPFLASLADEPGGLKWLDQAVSWAGKRGIYVILDLHGAPGGQSDQGHTGQAGVNAFFQDPKNIESAIALWGRLAKRYRGNSAVAGYDLINEPTGAQNSDTLYVVEDRMYRAVRAADPSHLIFIEDGYTGANWMPFPQACGWTNVVFSTHYYDFNAKSEDDQRKALTGYVADIEKQSERRNVPFYVGEFGVEPHGTLAVVQELLKTLEAKSISSSMWTYKVLWARGGHSLWSFYGNAGPIAPLDPYTDSEAQLIAKCGQLRSSELSEYAGMAKAFRDAAAADNGGLTATISL